MPQKKIVKLSDSEICDKWIKNKTINPETSRKIKETGPVYKKLVKKCIKKQSIPIPPKPKLIPEVVEPKIISKDSDNSFKSAMSSLNSENKKTKAYKKIYKLFIPYIKRTSANIIDRVNYYVILKNYLLSIKESNNCVRLYNFDSKTKKPIYRIGNKIILDKQIGSASVHGIVFLSHFKSNIKYGNKYDKLNKFAIKITNQNITNKKEIDILNKLTDLVINLKCPHFPITYGNLKCMNPKIQSNNSDDYSIAREKKNNKQYLPDLVNNNKTLFIQLNELAGGDLNSNFEIPQLNKDKLNTITQIYISIMFFHHYTNYYHNDTHGGNFLYHQIKPGGYFHYNIYGVDYYLENKGYLWVIWDFGLIKPLTTKKPIINDYDFLLSALRYFKPEYTSNEYYIIKNIKYILTKYENINNHIMLEILNKELLNYFLTNVPSFTTVKPSNIINKTPYIIKISSLKQQQEQQQEQQKQQTKLKKILNYIDTYILKKNN
jgi:hypothetical protein